MPLPLMALAMGASAASSLMGGMAANRANQQNADIAMLNYYAQQAAQRAAANESRRQQGEAHLGQTDAAGNRIQFIPGIGWVTTLSADQQAIQQGTEDEQLRALTSGAARAETVDARAANRRGREDVLASAAEDELRRVRPTETGRLRELLLARGAEQRNRGADAVGDVIARQALRAGGGANAAELVQGARGAGDQAASRQAGVDAELQAQEISQQQFDHQRDAASKLYDYFRRASTTGAQAPQGFNPTGPERLSSGTADQGLINTLARSPQQEYVNPNMGWADALGQGASALGAYGNYRQDQNMLDWYKQRNGGLGNTGVIS